MFWSTVSGGVRFGEFQAGSYSWSFDPEQTVTGRAEEVYTIFDTALTSIYISELWFESFIEAYFGNQEIEFAVVDGFVTYTCQSASLDHIYYMVDGHYLRLDQSDLTGEIQTTNGTYCYLKVEPINAPFNILGSQAYIDYYIEHNFNASTITITPAPDSQKRSLERVGKLPENEFAIKMYSENVEGGDIIALGIAIFCAVAAYAFLIYGLWYEYNTLESITTGGFIGWSLGGIVGAAIVFFVVNWIGLLLFMPGNVIEPMNPADESVITVTVLGPRMTILAIISALLIKLSPKPKAEQKKEETATVASAIEEYMTNDME